MNHQQNKTTSTLGLNCKTADGEGDNDFNSGVLHYSNNPLFPGNIVQADGETQNSFKLTTDQFEFLNIVANTIRNAAAMRGNSKVAPKRTILTRYNETDFCEKISGDAETFQHMSTVSEERQISIPDQQPIRKLRLGKRRNGNLKITTLRLPELLERALREGAVRRSLNNVISVNFNRCTAVNGIEENTFANAAMTGFTETRFQSMTVEIALNFQNLSTDFEPGRFVMPEIQPAVLPSPVICALETVEDVGFDQDERPKAVKAVRRRKPILLTLGRRLLKVSRMLCCWCTSVPSEDTE
ncbi:hypothetical protein QTP88_018403 [Uroleucon formosanum]